MYDFYNEKTYLAIRVKTLDTRTASRIKNPKQLYTSMKENIDKVVGFIDGSKSTEPLLMV
ncbi:hypothetical protein TI10_17925 [Photorhabdus luminescens subsp. luminescens]|uniref:endonuclease toxin domain-containing protein n=1 Tax=Photorhabdus TaxID=29487 RepID=UPI00066EB044|nr:hypothetical protein TI10_17925 [Photorhabdus luminescens subsp. luminescens]